MASDSFPRKQPRLKTLGFPVPVFKSQHAVHKPETVSQQTRIRGRALVEKRKAYWLANPNCELCGKFTMYPNGFELDHKQRLADHGSESDENTQLLCIGCHDKKTTAEGGKARR